MSPKYLRIKYIFAEFCLCTKQEISYTEAAEGSVLYKLPALQYPLSKQYRQNNHGLWMERKLL